MKKENTYKKLSKNNVIYQDEQEFMEHQMISKISDDERFIDKINAVLKKKKPNLKQQREIEQYLSKEKPFKYINDKLFRNTSRSFSTNVSIGRANVINSNNILKVGDKFKKKKF